MHLYGRIKNTFPQFNRPLVYHNQFNWWQQFLPCTQSCFLRFFCLSTLFFIISFHHLKGLRWILKVNANQFRFIWGWQKLSSWCLLVSFYRQRFTTNKIMFHRIKSCEETTAKVGNFIRHLAQRHKTRDVECERNEETFFNCLHDFSSCVLSWNQIPSQLRDVRGNVELIIKINWQCIRKFLNSTTF